jgi:hypothetical protein
MPGPYTAFNFGDPSPQAPLVSIKLFGIAVRTAASIPVWPSFTFPPGFVGQTYSCQFDLAPASSPTTYSVVSGSLPPGLVLNNLSADLGSISGIPTLVGSYTFTLEATNAYGVADQAFTIVISAAGGGGSYTWVS